MALMDVFLRAAQEWMFEHWWHFLAAVAITIAVCCLWAAVRRVSA